MSRDRLRVVFFQLLCICLWPSLLGQGATGCRPNSRFYFLRLFFSSEISLDFLLSRTISFPSTP